MRNALTGTALIEDIVQTAAWANFNRRVSALIITGDGTAFSSGGNVMEMREKVGLFGGNPAELQEQYRPGIQRIPLAMQSLEVPTIGAISHHMDDHGEAVNAFLDKRTPEFKGDQARAGVRVKTPSGCWIAESSLRSFYSDPELSPQKYCT